MKNKILTGVLLTITTLSLLSLTSVNGRNPENIGYSRTAYVIPLKIKSFIVVTDYKKVYSYAKKGYVLQDIDIVALNVSQYENRVVKYYTLIKY